ncbi:MAG: sel1 repeat family protein, partial [Gammaproteobacteria bacterium]|nr:sel1 repeat family protein [Gammaproteobacteria bacterium]
MKSAFALMILLLSLAQVAIAEEDDLLLEDPVQLGHQAYVSGEFQRALKLWTPLAEQGIAQAQFFLSNLYARGEGVEADPVAALSWLTRAAKGGYAPAQFNLGNRFYQGLWVNKDLTEARQWWLKAVEQGLSQAAYNLAGLHYQGAGVEKNLAQALHWYRRAAEAGSIEAKVVLAKLDEGAESLPLAQPIAPQPTQPATTGAVKTQPKKPVVVGTPEESAAWIKEQA